MNNKGFTLIELMIVIAIIGILLAISPVAAGCIIMTFIVGLGIANMLDGLNKGLNKKKGS